MNNILDKNECIAIGLMSGTSTDGIDAAVVSIKGAGTETSVRLLGFTTVPFSDDIRQRILQIASGKPVNSRELCLFNFLFGELSADACIAGCKAAGVSPEDIDFVGSHGQTIWHEPVPTEYLGHKVNGTLQTGEASVIAERLSCPVVSDFRVRDMAAGGLGAPLVPYTEYLLYRDPAHTIALQNIGGIGNITILPAGCSLKVVSAFDTGPGNMIIDALVSRITNGEKHYDDCGRMALSGTADKRLLDYLIESDDYIKKTPPKTTGREHYGPAFVEGIINAAHKINVSDNDMIATVTMFTAVTISSAIDDYCTSKPERLIVGGGGSRNPALMNDLKDLLPKCQVMTNEDIGLNSDAKEAVAFAVLANETLHGLPNNAPGATGASHPVVMGKISL